MNSREPVRWGILGTANIARASFLPGLRAAGDGVAFAVAGRDPARTRQYAADNVIEHAIDGYANLVANDRVDAVYVALPNSLHAEWTIAALRAGKAVLCEKPLCASLAETEEVLAVAREASQPLWEAFVFPFQTQMTRLRDLAEGKSVGEIREIHSSFHFLVRSRDNIRLSPTLGGGALNDVGCYSVRLARLVFGSEPTAGMAMARWPREGVDEEMQGVLGFPQDRRLVFSCGMSGPNDTFARLIGDAGEIRLTNPFHPRDRDTLEVRTPARVSIEHTAAGEPPFTDALRHIHAVLQRAEEPRHLATEEALGNAIALDLLYRSAREGRLERPKRAERIASDS